MDEVDEAIIEEYAEGVANDEDMEDQIEDQTEKGMEVQEDIPEEHGPYPQEEVKKDVLHHITNTILGGKHQFKTGNLVWEELGKPTFSVRFWLNLGSAAKQLFDMDMVASYCYMKGGITTDTSLSRDGYINDLTVTSRKVKSRQESGELKKFLENRNKK